nr:L,D-transpeptidase family protein [Lysobacter ruishenii]
MTATRDRSRALQFLLGTAALLALGLAASPGAHASATDNALQPGAFHWSADMPDDGPTVIVVSLPEQRLHVYRDGRRVALSTISSGKPGKETPTGVFPILQKKRQHRSNLYEDAPMPYMQRLTWDGIALHAGRIPGHPASHGCIRLPHAFAERLFGITKRDHTLVVVADDSTHDASVIRPGDRVPVDAWTGESLASRRMADLDADARTLGARD